MKIETHYQRLDKEATLEVKVVDILFMATASSGEELSETTQIALQELLIKNGYMPLLRETQEEKIKCLAKKLRGQLGDEIMDSLEVHIAEAIARLRMGPSGN